MAQSGRKSIKITAPIMKISGAYVWMDKDWPATFFDWLIKEKLNKKLTGMTQMQNKIKLHFVTAEDCTIFGLKYDKAKIFRT
jgi:hypothetical protein